MNNELDEEIREFLIESDENLALLDQQIVQLEQQPLNQQLISSVFRTIHSVKGTCGFFGFDILGSVTHLTESILGQLREGKRVLTPELITLILEAVDAVKSLLQRIKVTGTEGNDDTEALREKLELAYLSCANGDALHDLLRNTKPEATNTPTTLPQTLMSASVLTLTTSEPGSASAEDATVSATREQASAVIPAAGVASPSPASNTSPAEKHAEGMVIDSTIRVDVNLLDQLMNLVGELVLTRNQLLQSAGQVSSGIQQTSQRLNIITTELQEGVMKTRMQPIGMIWNKLPRVVRDLSAKCGKQIRLDMQGAETELDRSLIEAIRDPLTHIVRNSCDHGIESPQERIAKGKPPMGLLSLRAFHEAGAVNIEILDDGAGVDPDRVRFKAVEKGLITTEQAAQLSTDEAINLIFLPGFSTAQQITSISGRGVGMDVVKTNIEKISGSVRLFCPPAGGTCLQIKIPLTLAIIPGLIVSCDPVEGNGSTESDRFVIPQSHLVELMRIDLSGGNRNVDEINGALIFRHRGKLLPIVYLSSLLHKKRVEAEREFINIVVLQVQGKQFGLVVDHICDTQEIVVKPLGKLLKHLPCYGGATIMGDGRPALILDVGGIARYAELDGQSEEGVSHQPAVRQTKSTTEFVLFHAGTNHRMALPLSIVNRLEELPATSVEYAAGQAVIRYRGGLLPLLTAGPITGDSSLHSSHQSTIHVVVIHNGSQPFGLIVDGILDIVEEEISAARGCAQPGLLGSAVIGGMVTDIVDAATLYERFGASWNRIAEEDRSQRCIAIFDSSWSLGAEMLHTFLTAAGYQPRRVASAAELKTALMHGKLDALLVDSGDGGTVPEWLIPSDHGSVPFTEIPVVELVASSRIGTTASAINSGSIKVDRHDRTEILRTVARVMCAPHEKAA